MCMKIVIILTFSFLFAFGESQHFSFGPELCTIKTNLQEMYIYPWTLGPAFFVVYGINNAVLGVPIGDKVNKLA